MIHIMAKSWPDYHIFSLTYVLIVKGMTVHTLAAYSVFNDSTKSETWIDAHSCRQSWNASLIHSISNAESVLNALPCQTTHPIFRNNSCCTAETPAIADIDASTVIVNFDAISLITNKLAKLTSNAREKRIRTVAGNALAHW